MMRPSLRPGETRRHAPVSEEDPNRQRLVALVSVRVAYEKARRNGDKANAIKFFNLYNADAARYIQDNIGLCKKTALRMDSGHVALDELINACVVGFKEALDKFDLDKAGKVSTFAVHRMRFHCNELVDEKQGNIVKIPGDIIDDHRMALRTQNLLCNKLGRAPTLTEVLTELRSIESARNKTRHTFRHRWAKADEIGVMDALSVPVSISTNHYLGGETLRSDDDPRHSDEPLENIIAVRQALNALAPKYRAVIAEEFQIDDADLDLVPIDPVRRGLLLELAMRKLKCVMARMDAEDENIGIDEE